MTPLDTILEICYNNDLTSEDKIEEIKRFILELENTED